ncbi:MAG: branched-chain amino acid transaminase [Deltaproteobacteria bacterium]|nr:branched-chain amino acid transaminase [Deltaproteobacteria bacterium]
MIEKVDKIWMDGELVNWDDAKVHVISHTLHYGLGVFEGIRCYKRENGQSVVFRLKEHVDRLLKSAHIAGIEVRWSASQVFKACLDTVRVNKLDECYMRPLVFLGAGDMGLFSVDNPVHLVIVVWRWGTYLGDEGLEKGIRAKVSSYTRPGINISMTKAKIVGHYVNSILAKREVINAGYQEAVILDSQGYVAEATGENVFMIKRGKLLTPPLGCSILNGITRDTIFELCSEMEIPCEERLISRDELYIADEVFLTGSAAEITPIREIDDRKIGDGNRGPITKQLQESFFQIVRGSDDNHMHWLAVV